jgi:16S rRNA C967 or C1407 C5-methylase (RsmB/RsmF family)
MKNFHEHHILNIFKEFEADKKIPFDLLLNRYTRQHKALGSKDRKVIGESCFELIRWAKLLDQDKGPLTWKERLHLLLTSDLQALKSNSHLLPSTRCSSPEWIFQKLKKEYGEAEALKICLILNERAPLTVRANRIKITRDELYERLSKDYKIKKCNLAKDGISFDEHAHLISSPLYEQGFFEMQDEASQYVSSLIQAKPGDLILDYCSGSGGKTLAFAPDMKNQGQIYLHDIRPSILYQAKKRLKKAGIQNGQCLFPDEARKKGLLKGKMDAVLVDAPCSGSGTWRRNPDQKWKFTEKEFQDLQKTQQQIFREACAFVKPKGRILYATCSLFPEENERQVEKFLKELPLKLEEPPFKSNLQSGQMDGFFAALFIRSCE